MRKHRPKTTRRARASARGARWWIAGGLLLSLTTTGCVTMAEFRKLEERVIDSSRSTNSGPDPFERIAALSAEVEALRSEQRRLAGELEVAQKTVDDALEEARKARQALATQSAGGAVAATGSRAALMITRSVRWIFAAASATLSATAAGMTTAPCWSACTMSPSATRMPATVPARPESTIWT